MFEIGFLTIRIWDILDILIVAFIFYRIYKLIRNTLTLYIFSGVILISIVWWLVTFLKMELLSLIFQQLLSVGVIALVIIFQPELRKFLLMLGNKTITGEWPLFNIILKKVYNPPAVEDPVITQLQSAMIRMSKERTGALIVFVSDANLPSIENSGILLDSEINKPLILSLFNKESPLHDGAMIIAKNKIHKVSCILPVSDSINIPSSAGLRHRAGVGITEISPAKSFIVSEETGMISYAERGILQLGIDEEKTTELLKSSMAF